LIGERLDSPVTRDLVKKIRQRFDDFQLEENVDPARLFGVGTDGRRALFVRRRSGGFEVDSPQKLTTFTVMRLLRGLTSLGRGGKSYTPDNLASDFGSGSRVGQQGVKVLCNVVASLDNPKAKTFFDEWKTLFAEVCGYDVYAGNRNAVKLASHYGLPEDTAAADLMFAVHSYYALFMKFLAAEIVGSLSAMGTSVIKKCAAAPSSASLKREMETLEQGGIWTQLGIVNFLEGDLFSWYLSAWDEEVASVVADIARQLGDYDPSTLSADPVRSRDLLKMLYHELFPRRVRHDLGEYYTPDWLAEHVLNEVGYEGDPDTRILDPACGSGTFLVMAINQAKEWFYEHQHSCGYGLEELLKRILRNVVGFDLNPLAVMAARTNYLIAVRDLLKYASRVELPIYLCDSIVTPSEYGRLFEDEAKTLSTAVGEFVIPAEIASSSDHIGLYAQTLEDCVRGRYSADEFVDRCQHEGIPTGSEELHRNLYSRLLELDEGNRNGIWARIIKNAFAPLFVEAADFVVGNPPWVNWDAVPAHYRTPLINLHQTVYGLFPHKGLRARLGSSETDLSVLMTYVSADHYLRRGGKLGFVITQTVFKSTAAEGFRKFNVRGTCQAE
jgi:SAM-dependent methyltransferase